MFTESELQELLEFKSEHPVLSIYINTDPTEGSADAYKLRMRGMLKDIDLAADVEAVYDYVGLQHEWTGKSLAIFSCQAENFLRTFSFNVPIRERVRINNRPHVKPLADLLDAYGRYGVVLVDKQGARFFYFHLGELVEQEGFMGEEVRHIKHGGASTAPGRRGGTAGQTNYFEEMADRNMKEAVDFATRFFTQNHVRRVVIGGTDENVNLFRSHLPKAWQSLVVGDFNMPMTTNTNEILQGALEIGQVAEHKREAHLVQTLITNAAKGKGGVLTLDDTLGALHEGKIMTLVIQEGYRAPGYRCTSCRYLTARRLDACPFCSNPIEEISDAVELAVSRVMREGGEVEVLRNGVHLKEHGNIGAILRY